MSKENQLSHADKTLRGLRHIGGARVFTQLVTWALTAVTINLLQPRDYGLIAMAGIFTSFAQLLLDGGLAEVLISQRDLPERVQGAAASAVFLISLVFALIVAAIAPAASAFFHSPQLTAILVVSAFYLPLVALDVVPVALLSRRMEFGRIALAQMLSSVVQGVATLGLAYSGRAYWALIIGNFIGTGIRVAMLWFSLERKPAPNVHLATLRPLLRNSSQMIGQRLAYFSIENFDLFILSRFGGAETLGPYAVARTLSHSALNQIAGIVNQVSVPAFAAKSEAGEQLRGLVSMIALASAILFPLFWIMGVASQLGLPLVFGARWSKLVVPFLAFAAILPLRGVHTLLGSSVVGTGRMSTTFKNTLSWALISMPFMLFGLTWGTNGVALSWIAAFPIVFYIAIRRIAGSFSAPASMLLRPMMTPAVCAAASALAAQVVLWVDASRFLPPVALVAIQCSVGTLCYWALYRTLDPAHYSQTLGVIRRVVRV